VRTALAIALALLWVEAQAQQRADVNIVNERQRDVEIGVLDQVCNVVIYRGHLLREAETTVDCCTDAAGRCKLTIEDQTGHRQDYDGLPGTVYLRPR
jgi:anti-sigma regulatory factor (Ser/Thr protein kinase)